ncbi:MAG: hypothetical protein HYX92_03105 [Chloroflexi bacterium]|nr:hypothetical protein [Chloroflexota bacterium]
MPSLQYALVADVLTGLGPETIKEEVAEAFPEILKALTTTPATSKAGPATPMKVGPADRERFEGDDWYDAFKNMNRAFLERGWSDGLPLMPATEEQVRLVLRGTTRDPQDVVAILAPGNGVATVEKIAICAAMAGSDPRYLPVLIAAVEAMCAPGVFLRAMAMSTTPHAPLLLVNGPIARELKINSGRCALGPGPQSHANITIGRALRLVLMNVGHAYPGKMDMDTIGSSRKFSLCMAENEEKSGWAPLHMEKGFPREASTVTVFVTRDEIDVNDLVNWTPEGVLNTIADYTAIPGGDYVHQLHPGDEDPLRALVVLCPEHAQIVARAGWAKSAVKDYLHQHSQISAKKILNKARRRSDKVRPQWRWLLELSEDAAERVLLPVLKSPEHYDIVVVGGPAGKSLVFRTLGAGSTAAIRDRSAI